MEFYRCKKKTVYSLPHASGLKLWGDLTQVKDEALGNVMDEKIKSFLSRQSHIEVHSPTVSALDVVMYCVT